MELISGVNTLNNVEGRGRELTRYPCFVNERGGPGVKLRGRKILLLDDH